MAAPTSIRLPDHLDERLSAYCLERGCVKSRVISIAVADYLGSDATHAPPASFPRFEPRDDEPEAAR